MTAAATEILALLAPDSPDTWPQGIFAAADLMEHDASLCSLGEGPFLGADPDDGARLVEWMLAAVHHWRGVAERHKRSAWADGPACAACHVYTIPRTIDAVDWPCPDLTETADEARTYLSGAS